MPLYPVSHILAFLVCVFSYGWCSRRFQVFSLMYLCRELVTAQSETHSHFSQREEQTPSPDIKVYCRIYAKCSLVPRNRFIQTKWGKELIARKRLSCSWIWKAQQETWWRRGALAMASVFQGGFVFLWWLIWSLLLVIPVSPLAWLVSCSRDLLKFWRNWSHWFSSFFFFCQAENFMDLWPD